MLLIANHLEIVWKKWETGAKLKDLQSEQVAMKVIAKTQ